MKTASQANIYNATSKRIRNVFKSQRQPDLKMKKWNAAQRINRLSSCISRSHSLRGNVVVAGTYVYVGVCSRTERKTAASRRSPSPASAFGPSFIAAHTWVQGSQGTPRACLFKQTRPWRKINNSGRSGRFSTCALPLTLGRNHIYVAIREIRLKIP